jgi:hypothetical protein
MAAEEAPGRSIWGGFTSVFKSVIDTTLGAVDNLQDKITALESQLTSKNSPPKKQFDNSLLPILENSSTYLDQPTSLSYPPYLESFDMDAHSEDISLFCDHSPTLRRIHSRLVPSAFPDRVFWSRLFFKLEQKDAAKKKSQQLLELVVEDNGKAAAETPGDAPIDLTEAELAELERLVEGDADGPNDWE